MAALPESGSASTCRTPTQALRHSSMPRAYPAAAMAMSRVIGAQRNHLLFADRPCIFTTGIDDPDLIVALPIGPWKAFMATKTDRVASIIRQQRPQNLLMQINESSLSQAKQRVYARDASPRCFISNRLTKM